MSMRLGFIGIGAMGRPLALRLLRAGFPLTVCDADPAALAVLQAAGAQVAATPAETASQAELVFACLPAPAISEQVAFGPDGVIHGTTIKLYVEMSTIGAATMERIATTLGEHGIGVLDAPVSGGPTGEATGRLICFVAAARTDFERATPALEGLSDRLFHIGERPGQAQVLKLANNMLNAGNLALACEMVLMTTRAGIDAATAIDVINVSTGRSRATEETFKKQILSDAFSTGARLSILQKDVMLAVTEAEALGAAHELASAVRATWDAAAEAGRGADDLSTIYHFIEEQGRKTT
jgi:3-hydroxyisobutyrate dehydrogenase-like beta-hydroxyacid dehydrogenase